MDATEKILARDQIAAWVRTHRDASAPIVLTNGVFDLLHLGHVRYLQQARALGAVLLVGLNSDRSTRRLKGTQRPLVPEDERAEMLAGLACVDAVTIFAEDTAVALVAQVRPEIYVKGGDYAGVDARGTLTRIGPEELRRLARSSEETPDSPAVLPNLFTRLPEARAVAQYGGSLCLIPYLRGHSTSELIERIANRYRG